MSKLCATAEVEFIVTFFNFAFKNDVINDILDSKRHLKYNMM